jgi:hypothetical protein
MQQILSIVAAATAFATVPAGTGAVAMHAPISVTTCAVNDLYGSTGLDDGPPITYRLLEISFHNTDDAVATQVSFDVSHSGGHSIVIDRGRFSKGVTIAHRFNDDFFDGRGGPDTCTVTAVTFADGRTWTAPDYGTPRAALR